MGPIVIYYHIISIGPEMTVLKWGPWDIRGYFVNIVAMYGDDSAQNKDLIKSINLLGIYYLVGIIIRTDL